MNFDFHLGKHYQLVQVSKPEQILQSFAVLGYHIEFPGEFLVLVKINITLYKQVDDLLLECFLADISGGKLPRQFHISKNVFVGTGVPDLASGHSTMVISK